MKNILAALLLTILPAAASAAADGQETPSIYAKLKPKVGSWAEYRYESMKGDKVKSKGLFRIAIVGKEGDSLWIEQKMTPEIPKPKRDGAGMIMKFLMNKEGLEKAYMKSERGVMDMTGMMISGARKKQAAIDQAKMTEAGAETVEVPAGKFKTTRYTFEEEKNSGDAWLKPGVGPYGLIKQVHRGAKETSTMQLLSSGADAKSEVDEKSAQTAMGVMTGRPEGSRKNEPRDAAPEKPDFGGLFKNALKKKAGLGGD